MRHRLTLLLVSFVLALAVPLTSAGTAAVTKANVGGGVTKITIAWTSDASGAVSGTTFSVPRGELLQAKFVPSSTAQPTADYDVTLVDSDGVDYLAGVGADLSNTEASIVVPLVGNGTASVHRPWIDGTEPLELRVSNAGNAKAGTVVLWIGR